MTSTGPDAPLPEHPIDSLRATSYLDSLTDRVAEWPSHTLTVMPFIMIVWLGMWAARRGILENPSAHRVLLRRAATGGLTIAFLGGLPLGLVSAGVLHTDDATLQSMTLLQGASGMFGGPGFVALFALLAAWIARTIPQPRTHLLTGPLAALGQRSLSGYLFQSIVWLIVLAPYTLNLQSHIAPLPAALATATLTWLITLIAAFWMERRNLPGPAERVLRLTYGARPQRR